MHIIMHSSNWRYMEVLGASSWTVRILSLVNNRVLLGLMNKCMYEIIKRKPRETKRQEQFHSIWLKFSFIRLYEYNSTVTSDPINTQRFLPSVCRIALSRSLSAYKKERNSDFVKLSRIFMLKPNVLFEIKNLNS